ncbi:Mitochondrial distribution and morphology protein 12, partial [Tieghemiomyces parasiticus]
MSFQIFWDRLDSGVARTIQERLNARLATLPKPDMIGDLSITDLDLGSVAPHVEILDITDPYPEFYLPETPQAG